MKSPSLFAVSTVESSQLLFKILEHLPFFFYQMNVHLFAVQL